MGEQAWLHRLRWRLLGATQWPTFVAVVILDALLLDRLPVDGDRGPGPVGALLLSGFVNLFIVAVCGPLVATAVLRRRHPGTPPVVRNDQAATLLLVVATVVIAGLGLAHRPQVDRARADASAQAQAARAFLLAHAPLAFRGNVDRLDTWKQGPDLYRTCVPGSDPTRAFCVIVMTDRSPARVALDPDRRPNEIVRGRG